jgi:hypothetical protein
MENISHFGSVGKKKGKIPLERNDKFKATKNCHEEMCQRLGKEKIKLEMLTTRLTTSIVLIKSRKILSSVK